MQITLEFEKMQILEASGYHHSLISKSIPTAITIVRIHKRVHRLSPQSVLNIEASGYYHSSRSKSRPAAITIVRAQN